VESVIAYIGLGGNIGDRRTTLTRTLDMLDARDDVAVRKVSDFIETEPVGKSGQDKYLNAAAEIETTLGPRELLAVLHQVEAALGRNRELEGHWGPRTCDLDLLLYGALVEQSDDLKLPHPYIQERPFVLQPLAQIAPDVVHPTINKTIAELWSELQGRP